MTLLNRIYAVVSSRLCVLCLCMCCCSSVVCVVLCVVFCFCFFFQAEDGIRDLVRSRGLGDVYKRQAPIHKEALKKHGATPIHRISWDIFGENREDFKRWNENALF